MPRRVVLGKTGIRSQVVTDFHCRAGYMRKGKHSKVWCSCGFSWQGEVTYTGMEKIIEEHKRAEAGVAARS